MSQYSIAFEEILQKAKKLVENISKDNYQQRANRNLHERRKEDLSILKKYHQENLDRFNLDIANKTVDPKLISGINDTIIKTNAVLNELETKLEKRERDYLSLNLSPVITGASRSNPVMDGPTFISFACKILSVDFDGNPEKLSQFLDTLKILKNHSAGHEQDAACLARTKISGNARYLISEEDNLSEIIEKLKTGIQSEKPASIIAKMNSIGTTADLDKQVEVLSRKLQSSYISMGMPKDLAMSMTTEQTIKTLRHGTRDDEARYGLKLNNFSSPEQVLEKYRSWIADTPAAPAIMVARHYRGTGQPRGSTRYRGNFRGQYRQPPSAHFRHNPNQNNYYNSNRNFPHNQQRGQRYADYAHRRGGRNNNQNVRVIEQENYHPSQ